MDPIWKPIENQLGMSSGQMIIFQQPRFPWKLRGFPSQNATFWGLFGRVRSLYFDQMSSSKPNSQLPTVEPVGEAPPLQPKLNPTEVPCAFLFGTVFRGWCVEFVTPVQTPEICQVFSSVLGWKNKCPSCFNTKIFPSDDDKSYGRR